jgi:hypothetical protein
MRQQKQDALHDEYEHFREDQRYQKHRLLHDMLRMES